MQHKLCTVYCPVAVPGFLFLVKPFSFLLKLKIGFGNSERQLQFAKGLLIISVIPSQ